MAVISISRIQIRRGFQEELPQLASGEMGWSIDQRRLFIGNGTLSEGAPAIGNTEILTQNSDVLSAIASYAFVGIESGYRSVTGVSLSTPTFRTLQNKIDETMASVRDFGAIGNGIADDTVSLQRAINQVWPPSFFNTVGIRRRLHVPAGTYLISAALTIPPFASIYGDGALSSIIKQVYSAADSTIKLSDSKGQVDGALGTNGAILPFQIDINDLTLSNITDNHIAIVNSAKDVAFNRVKFLGNIAAPVSVGTSRAAVLLIGSTNPVTRVSFNACHASQITYGVVAQGAVSDVVGEICEFDTLYNAMQLSAASGASPSGIKILTSSFANIANAAIVSNDYSSVTSAFNHYKTVGYGNATIINSGMVSTPALQWANPNNYSIGDLFDRTANLDIIPLITITNTNTPTALQQTASGSLQTGTGYTETLADNTIVASNTNITLVSPSNSIIDYGIFRANTTQVGTIKITQFSGNAHFVDDSVVNGPVGVVFDVVANGNNVIVTYTTTSTGTPATFKYNIRSFI